MPYSNQTDKPYLTTPVAAVWYRMYMPYSDQTDKPYLTTPVAVWYRMYMPYSDQTDKPYLTTPVAVCGIRCICHILIKLISLT